MASNTDLIVSKDDNKNAPLEGLSFFGFQDNDILWSSEFLQYSDFLEKLVFRIARNPKALKTHLQRIYFCFHKNLNEQLFAAIVDFLVILNKRGLQISWRMLSGTKSHLNPEHFKVIKDFLNDQHANVNHLQGNQYSVLTRGKLGTEDMISYTDSNTEVDFDPLEIARDHIEYSQLEEAKRVLENAIFKQPTRTDLQRELLALFRSTRDYEGFTKMLAELKRSGLDIIDEWNELNNLFKGRNNNG
jgi:hypothetical protein